MKQGRKSKTVLALVCMLGALLALGAAASVATAQGPAADEYDLGPLPGAEGETPARGSEAGGTGTPQVSEEDTSGGSGASTLLILLVAVAAVCTALAIWRLRRGDDADDDPRGVGPTTGEGQSA